MDHQDHIARIKVRQINPTLLCPAVRSPLVNSHVSLGPRTQELEQHLQLRDLELLQLRGAHPVVQMGAFRGHATSDDARAGGMSVGH